ncbi:MAG: chromosome segregation protein SMC, partial [Thermodesulfovibrionales bacterium]
MQVEKIELIGFKSFAEKTIFHLHPGITCIVGPNGAGKSNIVDSFRWVLGEQSAKSLRGDKMEEVIFAGSATKKPRGMAEVNLYLFFDVPEGGNGDGRNVTVVTRRLYRSGESEYLINKRQCRLKDIRDLFLDSGLEVKSYSILEQGRIVDILNSKPQDRRFLIEEVAGVMKYKVRKTEALSKLELSRQNLQRINDIIIEVKRQINSLDRQVKKAERFKRLSSEIRDLELKIAKRDYSSLKDNLDETLSRLKDRKEEEALLRSELNRIENDIETKKIGLVDKEKFLEGIVSELSRTEREIAEIERSVAVFRTETNSLNEYLTRLSAQEVEVEAKISESERRKEELSRIEGSISIEMDGLRDLLREKSNSVRDIEETISDREEEIEAKRKEIFRIAEDISRIRNDMARTMTIKENLEKREQAILKDREVSSNSLSDIEAKIKETETLLGLKETELHKKKKEKEELTSFVNTNSLTLENLRTEIARLREELASSVSRLHSLKEMIHEEIQIDAISDFLHVISTVADVIEVEESYEKAIENVLSEKIKALIVRSSEDILRAMSDLRGMKRTSFLPLDLPEIDLLPFPEDSKIVGRAMDFVKLQEGREDLAPLLERLLSNILIIKDLSDLPFTPSPLRPFTLVTPDGDVIEPGGTVTIGEGRGILRRKREIRELENRSKVIKETIGNKEREFSQIETNLNNDRKLMKEIDSLIVNAEKDISLLRLTLETQEEEKKRIQRKLSHLNTEFDEVTKEINSLRDVVSSIESELKSLNMKKEEAEAGLSGMQEEIGRVKVSIEQERAFMTDLRLSLNSCKEKLDSIRKERESLSGIIDDLIKRRGGFKEERERVLNRINQCNLNIAEKEEGLKEIAIKADSIRREINERREEIRKESDDIKDLEHQSRSL